MYLHIGNGKSVRTDRIIGIFDLDTATVSKSSKDFINRMEKEGAVEYADFDLPRSFVVIDTKKEKKVMLSRISTQGLKIRLEGGESIE